MTSALQNCEFCNSPAHVWFNCTKKPDGWKPDRLKKSTAARKDVLPLNGGPSVAERLHQTAGPGRSEGGKRTRKAGTQAPPVDTLKKAETAAAHLAPKKRGRPKGKTDRKAYQRDLMRKRRAEGK